MVEIPEEEIEEPGSFVLGTIKVYPFFGGVLEDAVPGYVFIPDGVGALVRYRKADPSIIANYKKEIYGSDLGYTAESNLNRVISDTNMIHAPVFGFVHGANQNAIFGNILSGAEYGNLNIYYAGRTTLYTTVFPEFVYRRTYRQPIDRAGTGFPSSRISEIKRTSKYCTRPCRAKTPIMWAWQNSIGNSWGLKTEKPWTKFL